MINLGWQADLTVYVLSFEKKSVSVENKNLHLAGGATVTMSTYEMYNSIKFASMFSYFNREQL